MVRGWEWTAVLLCGMIGAVQGVSMRWWSRKGEQATTAREQEGHLLRQCARSFGRRVLHLFDRGYAGAPWLGELGRARVRFVMRWPKRYQLRDRTGSVSLAWQIALGKRAWGAPRMIWDGQLRKLRQWLLERWCHRTGRRARKTRAPLYRLRWALSHLWQSYPPSGMRRSRQPIRPPGSDRLIAWLTGFLVFLNLCSESSILLANA